MDIRPIKYRKINDILNVSVKSVAGLSTTAKCYIAIVIRGIQVLHVKHVYYRFRYSVAEFIPIDIL